MRTVQWYEVQKFCKDQIEYCTARCIDIKIDEKERLIAAVELQTFNRVLNLQGEGAGIDERR